MQAANSLIHHQLAPAMVSVLAPLLLVLLLGSPRVVRAADHEDHYMIVEVSSLKPKGTCLGHRVIPPTNHTWLPVELRHGPCSPTLLDAAAAPSMEELLRRDQLRAQDVQRRLSNNGTDDSEAPGMAEGGGENQLRGSQIAVSMGSGMRAASSMQQQQEGSQLSVDHPAATGGGGGGGGVSTTLPPPGVMQTMVIDTASDVPWVQCVPCPIPPCHPQKDPVYDPTTSPTYAAFSCNSPTCRQLGPYANGCANNNQCQYRVAYPDGSSSSGTYISDMLTLNPTTTITNFQFGCSHADPGSFDNTTDGIMALGGGPESLVSQTAARFGRTFSYCLPPSASYLGFFMLGPRPLPSSSSLYLVTPMLRDTRAPPTFYRVLLRAIVVGGQRLDMPAAGGGGGGAVMVMDSRTLITRLPPTAYRALRAAFMSGMRMYRAAPPKGSLDTCYDFTGVRSVKLPRIAMVFDREVTVQLDPSGILFNGCLAFAANRDDRTPGIVGSVQQQTIEVHYDVAGGTVGFHRNAC